MMKRSRDGQMLGIIKKWNKKKPLAFSVFHCVLALRSNYVVVIEKQNSNITTSSGFFFIPSMAY